MLSMEGSPSQMDHDLLDIPEKNNRVRLVRVRLVIITFIYHVLSLRPGNEGSLISKKYFWPFRPQFGLKIREGGRGWGRPLTWIHH